MKQLSNSQQKLVEDNHNLIYSFMNKNKLSLNAVEDWYGTCAIALCKAALIFNPNKEIEFSTLAYVCMSNEMKMVLRNRDKVIKDTLSLDYNISENIRLGDCIKSKSDEFGEVDFYTILNKYYGKLNTTHKNIINDYIYTDMTQKDIGKKYNLSRSMICTVYNQFLNNIYSDLYESERE